MDSARFDRLARSFAAVTSRRAVLAGLVAGLAVPLEAAAKRGPGKSKGHPHRKDRRREPRRLQAQQEPCWRAGACIPSKGSNVSQCDFEGSTAFAGLDCTRCNVSRANLRGVDATGANFTRANLSGSCLVDADFTGAIFHPTNTNLYNAIFCRTTMPNGDVNNSGCNSPTACCPTCLPLGESGCGLGGSCCGGAVCCAGTCQECCTAADCPAVSCQVIDCVSNVCVDAGNEPDTTPCADFAPAQGVCCFGVCDEGECCHDSNCTGSANNCAFVGPVRTCVCGGNTVPCSGATPDCCGFPGGFCTNLDTDPDNCGGCGIDCGAGACVNGSCE